MFLSLASISSLEFYVDVLENHGEFEVQQVEGSDHILYETAGGERYSKLLSDCPLDCVALSCIFVAFLFDLTLENSLRRQPQRIISCELDVEILLENKILYFPFLFRDRFEIGTFDHPLAFIRTLMLYFVVTLHLVCFLGLVFWELEFE